MGAWGCESCANDSCWDALGDIGISNIHQMNPEEITKGIPILFEENFDDEDKLGCMIWFIYNTPERYIFDKNYIEKTLEIAKKMLDDEESITLWNNPSERKMNIKKEIEALNNVLKNGVATPVHVKGLLEKINDIYG